MHCNDSSDNSVQENVLLGRVRGAGYLEPEFVSVGGVLLLKRAYLYIGENSNAFRVHRRSLLSSSIARRRGGLAQNTE